MTVLYRRPSSLEEAIGELDDDDALVLAGGQSLVLLMNLGLVYPRKLVSLDRVPGLTDIRVSGAHLELGGRCTHAQLASDPLLATRFPEAPQVFARVGNPRVRASGTLGGNLVHADPAQDPPVLLTALDATVMVEGPKGRREIGVRDLASGLMTTELAHDEILTHVRVPLDGAHGQVSYQKFLTGSKDDYATVSVAAAITFSEDGIVRTARLAAGAVGPTVLSLRTAARAVEGRELSPALVQEVAELVSHAVTPSDDRRGSADFKRHLAGTVAARALRACAAQAGHAVDPA